MLDRLNDLPRVVVHVTETRALLGGDDYEYLLADLDGTVFYRASLGRGEVHGAWVLRWLRWLVRPLVIHVADPDGAPAMTVTCSGGWFERSARVDVFDASGNMVGTVQERPWRMSQYRVRSPVGDDVCELIWQWRPIFQRTYRIRVGGVDAGMITAEKVGLLKRFLSAASYFVVTFPGNTDPNTKALLVAAVFLLERAARLSRRAGN